MIQYKDAKGIAEKRVLDLCATVRLAYRMHNCNIVNFMNMTEDSLVSSTTVEAKAYAPDK